MIIRKANINDIERINEIYNQAVLNTTATIDTEPRPLEYHKKWFEMHNDRYAVFVALEDDVVVGWASLSLWSDKYGYRAVAEDSIYVDEAYKGRGIGDRLIKKIIEHAKENEFHTIIARISEGNDVSIHLHEKYGFKIVGTLKELGYKFNRYLDIHILQLIL
ncbi:MAG: L-amino acid N-acyltransferase [Thermoanaerobacterium sp.]|jgi:Acetyltransferase (GNAT) family.|nr:L-amino acid N-acyltransferase [Thermoanaerobacterium sp.]MDK2806580.1 L-amino acid N-acyltransferase [Thermoanaerobacterium sp.]